MANRGSGYIATGDPITILLQSSYDVIRILLGSSYDPITILLRSYYDVITILLRSHYDPIKILLRSYYGRITILLRSCYDQANASKQLWSFSNKSKLPKQIMEQFELFLFQNMDHFGYLIFPKHK